MGWRQSTGHGVMLALGVPAVLILGAATAIDSQAIFPIQLVGALAVLVTPGAAAIAAARHEAHDRKRIAVWTGIATGLAVAVCFALLTAEARCEPVTPIEAWPWVAAVGIPAGVAAWGVMRGGAALATRYGWWGLTGALAWGVFAVLIILVIWLYVSFAQTSGCLGP